MKSLIAILVMITLIFVGWFFIYGYVEDHATGLIHDLEKIEQNVKTEDWDHVIKQFKSVKSDWVNVRNKWAVLLDHHEIDNIDLAMARTDQYVQQKNSALSLGEIEVLKQLFQIVKESESLTLTNIL